LRCRVLAAGLAVAVITALVPGLAAQAAPLPPPDPASTITLITGDRISVHGSDVSPLPTPGRAGTAFHVYRAFGHTYVVPLDAAAGVASGRLDRRLFDVTALQQFGYGTTADIPLIVTGTVSGVTARALPSLTANAVTVTKGQAWAQLKDSAATVWLDGKRQVSLDESVPQIGAPTAWQAGFTGKGVTVAVLDTGIDATHPDFAGRIADARDFTSDNSTDDTIGHGTHVASTVAGSGAASNGKYRGVAPDATLVVGKVCQEGGCPDSAIIAGMEWATKEKKAQVVNMSLGGVDTPDIDPLEEAVNRLTAETGALFVVAAGNEVNGYNQVSSPSTADAALSVGAVDKKDVEAPYSNVGPRLGDGGVKPDIAAPGTDITAARAANSGLPSTDGPYTTASGTSMATPHVTGAAALLLQGNKNWHAADVKSALVSSAQPTAQASIFVEGDGRVDVARAIKQDVVSETASVNFGAQQWPHTDDQPVDRTVTYHNAGATSVTLDLATTAATFSLAQKQIVVPAGGDATVTVTSDTRTGPTGTLAGRLVATGGDVRISTPLTANSEPESYNLTLHQIGRDGAPAAITMMSLLGMDALSVEFPSAPSGTITIRKPKGNYILDSLVLKDNDVAHLTQPLVKLDHDTTITLDARQAQLVQPTVRGVDADVALSDVGLGRQFDSPQGRVEFDSGVVQNGIGHDLFTLYTKQYGGKIADKDLLAWVNFSLGKAGADRSFLNSPFAYHMFWDFEGAYPTGFAPQVSQREFAAVHQRYHAQTNQLQYGWTWSFGSTKDSPHRTDAPMVVTLPLERTEYYLADGRQWLQEFGRSRIAEGFPDLGTEDGPTEQLTAGRTYQRDWNQGVYGAAFAPAGSPPQYSSIRKDDMINIHAPGYADGVAGRWGYGATTKSSRIALYRDGRLVSERNNLFDCLFTGQPAQEATYRAEVDLQQDDTIMPLSSRTSIAWTFTSSHVDGIHPLPLMTVKISPELDIVDTAKAGRPLVLPIRIERNPDSAPSETSQVTLESSYDDGVTWHRIPVLKVGESWYAVTTNATSAPFASLRATAKDRAGNQVEQTFIHAYRIK
jgi:subtilisin family serine protease